MKALGCARNACWASFTQRSDDDAADDDAEEEEDGCCCCCCCSFCPRRRRRAAMAGTDPWAAPSACSLDGLIDWLID